MIATFGAAAPPASRSAGCSLSARDARRSPAISERSSERRETRASKSRSSRGYLPDYDKVIDPSSFSKLYEGYDRAVKRAQALDREASRHDAPGRNPTTGVYRLTESIKREGSP